MNVQKTIEKSNEELREDTKNVYELIRKGVLNEYHLFLFFRGHLVDRDKALIEAYKEELREKVQKAEAIIPPENSPEIYGIHRQGAYKQGYESAMSDVLSLINKKTEV